MNDAAVQLSIRDNFHNRKEQLLGAAYLAVARNNSKITNYLAQQVVESAGKLPVVTPKAADSTPPAPSK